MSGLSARSGQVFRKRSALLSVGGPRDHVSGRVRSLDALRANAVAKAASRSVAPRVAGNVQAPALASIRQHAGADHQRRTLVVSFTSRGNAGLALEAASTDEAKTKAEAELEADMHAASSA